MVKTIYRTSISEGANTLAEKLVIMAAKSNGGAKPITLEQMKTVVDGNTLEYSSLYKDITCEIIGENLLHIDQKNGDKWETVCRIEKVEIFDLPEKNEDDMPEDLFAKFGEICNPHKQNQ